MAIITRTLQTILLQSAQYFPVIGIFGPRQSGKTTCAKMTFSNYIYITLEDLDTRAQAQQDPRGFLESHLHHQEIIIDEFQYIPELLSYMQTIVDREKKKGYFILTGSQHFLMSQTIVQSLAGRIAIHTLLPFSFEELHSADLLPSQAGELICKGFYPSVHVDSIPTGLWYNSYIASYIERDVRQIIAVENLSLFRTFLKMCADRVGQLLNVSSLANDCGVSDKTIKRWLFLLETSFIIYLLQPYHRNFGKRLVKSPKLYFYDVGLASYLLNIETPDQLFFSTHRGGLFESMIISEMQKMSFYAGKRSDLYFWRDHSGNEIDCILEKNMAQLIPIEIKSGQTIQSNFSKGIEYWYTTTRLEVPKGSIVYAGEQSLEKKNVHIIGWKELKKIFGE